MSDEINSSNCNHNCEGCSANCGERTAESMRIEPNSKSRIRHIIGIVSGKGGVGKSFVASLLACELQRRGSRAAVLDGDITGPSMAKVFGVKEKLYGDGEVAFPAVTKSGIQLVSANMMLDSDDQPVIWRGPIVAGVIRQFYQEVYWNDVDYMVVDMPPGTSDVPLTVFQSMPVDGIIVVASPQELVGMVVEKAINMANMMNIPLIGLVENMSYVECGQCGSQIRIFGESHIDEIAEKYNIPVLAKIPMREGYAQAGDNGSIEDLEVPEIKAVANAVTKAA